MKKIRQLFPGANTPFGFQSLYRDGLAGINSIYILKGGPGVGKSTLMRKIGAELNAFGYEIELWQCSSDSASIDGVICRALSLAVIDGTAPHLVDPQFPGVREEIINLGEFWDQKKLQEHGTEIMELFKRISAEFTNGYLYLAKAYENRETLMRLCDCPYDKRQEKLLFAELFTPKEAAKFFSSAVTDNGVVSYAQSLSADYQKRCLLQGKHNKNSSLLLAAVSDAAKQRGLTVEEYFGPFEKEKPEMLLLPDLNIAVIDCTQSHIHLETQPGDKIIEMTPPLPSDDIGQEIEYFNAFEQDLEKAVVCFKRAKEKHDALEKFYIQAMDFDGVSQKGKQLIDKIMKFIKGGSL